MTRLLLLASLLLLQSCISQKPSATQTMRVGYLASEVMEHPVISDRDDYLDLYDQQGEWRKQIIIVFADALAAPTDRNRPIELKGTLDHIDLGGEPGTRGAYANDVLYVDTWRYLNPIAVPKKGH